jgi:hypothetical protein
MVKIRLGGVGLDCADPGPLGVFWAELLGGEVVISTEDLAVVALDRLVLNAYRVDPYVPPTWPGGPVPKQAHLDLDVDDLGATELRALSLGAVRADHQPAPDSYRVMLDPAGHPFCLTTQFAK